MDHEDPQMDSETHERRLISQGLYSRRSMRLPYYYVGLPVEQQPGGRPRPIAPVRNAGLNIMYFADGAWHNSERIEYLQPTVPSSRRQGLMLTGQLRR